VFQVWDQKVFFSDRSTFFSRWQKELASIQVHIVKSFQVVLFSR